MNNADNQVVFGTEGGRLVIRLLKGGHADNLYSTAYDGGDIWLKICVDDVSKLRFFYRRDGKVWQQAGDVEVDVFASLRRGHYKPGLINAGRGASDAAFRKFMMSRK